MILQRDIPTIRPWLMVCGSRDFRNPEIKHPPEKVLEVYDRWAELCQQNGFRVFPRACLVITSGTVSFIQEETAGRGTFEGLHIKGISLVDTQTTIRMLQDFGTHLLQALGQEVLEFETGLGVIALRLTVGVPIGARA